jgi:hypothetical protein
MHLNFRIGNVSTFVVILLFCSTWVVILNAGITKADSDYLIPVKYERFFIHEVLEGFSNHFVGSFNASEGYWIELDLSCSSTNGESFVVYVDVLSANHGTVFSAKGTEFSQTVYLDYEDVYNLTLAKSPFYSSVRINGTIDVCRLEEDTEPPIIFSYSQQLPSFVVEPSTVVKITANVADSGSGVASVLISYCVDNGTKWNNRTMTFDPIIGEYRGTIPTYPLGTSITYILVLYDVAGNCRIVDNQGYKLGYTVVPEFPLWIIIPLFLVATLSAIVVKKKIIQQRTEEL